MSITKWLLKSITQNEKLCREKYKTSNVGWFNGVFGHSASGQTERPAGSKPFFRSLAEKTVDKLHALYKHFTFSQKILLNLVPLGAIVLLKAKLRCNGSFYDSTGEVSLWCVCVSVLQAKRSRGAPFVSITYRRKQYVGPPAPAIIRITADRGSHRP